MVLNQIQNLTSVPDILRDQAWSEEFLNTLFDTPLKPIQTDVALGKDNKWYFMLKTDPHQEDTALTTFSDAIKKCAELKIGLMINPYGQKPDWIFSAEEIEQLYYSTNNKIA